MTDLITIKNELKQQMGDRETMGMLLKTTFKGLSEGVAKTAAMEAVMRGFEFKDFLEKNVYAIPFKDDYSLVTSIDYARKKGMKNGVVGISEPKYVEKDGKIISCTVTVKRKVDDYVGEYSATVYFLEYSTGYNLWKSKPRTMIAKVAEMHALRKACPEDLSQSYTEEEMQAEVMTSEVVDEKYKDEIDAIEVMDELIEYHQKNKGKGKEFDNYIIKKKNELEISQLPEIDHDSENGVDKGN